MKEEVKAPVTKAKILPPNVHLYAANLELFGKEFAKLLMENPEKPVAVDTIDVQGLKNPGYLFIIGFSSMGLLRKALASKKDIKYIAIIEPNIGRFHAAMKREHLQELATSKTIDLVLGTKPEELIPELYNMLAQFNSPNGPKASVAQCVEYIVDPFAYPQVDGKVNPEASVIIDQVNKAAQQIFLAMGCSADSHFRWEQFIRNQKNLFKSYQSKELFNKFQDVPAIVIGAGPSLKDFINAAKEHDLASKSILICCDASLRLLLENGIKPHIVIRCERKLTTIFTGISKENTEGVYYAPYPWTSPEYFDLFHDSIMLYRDNGVCKWSKLDPGSVNGGVSSGNAALELAFELGCKNIFLTGIDLCMMDGKTHIEGTEVEFDAEKSKAKWSKIPGNSGEVTTIPVWYRCLNEYLVALNKHSKKNCKVFNTSLNGAKIIGTEVQPWSEIINVFNKEIDVRSMIEANKSLPSDESKKEFYKQKEDLRKILYSYTKEYKKARSFISDLMLTAKREEEKAIAKLKVFYEPTEFYIQVDGSKKSLCDVYTEVCRQVDKIKEVFFTKELFTLSVLDICQHSYFQTENKISASKNVISDEHNRLKQYVILNIHLMEELCYYSEKLIALIDGEVETDFDYKMPELKLEVPDDHC